MCIFKQIRLNEIMQGRKRLEPSDLAHIKEIYVLLKRWSRVLFDDFSPLRTNFCAQNVWAHILHYEPFFWVILDKNGDFAGFIYLYDVIGGEKPHSACVSVCFKQKYWGKFTKKSLEKFKKYCFKDVGLKKIKAEIFPANTRVKGLLRFLGFEFAACLKGETQAMKQISDVEIWELHNTIDKCAFEK